MKFTDYNGNTVRFRDSTYCVCTCGFKCESGCKMPRTIAAIWTLLGLTVFGIGYGLWGLAT